MTMLSPNSDCQHPYDRETDGFDVDHLQRTHAEAEKELRAYIIENFGRFHIDFALMGANYRVMDILDALQDTLSDVLGGACNEAEDG